MSKPANIDPETVAGFGEEWDAFDQTTLSAEEYADMFDRYFSIFPMDQLTAEAEGFDLGCGSGRWAASIAPRVKTLHCIDPSEKALAVARRQLNDAPSAQFHLASVDAIPLADGSQDFGYSLGVLHHIPDTAAALADCVLKLKPGAPFQVYLYYRFDNRPLWFRLLWRSSDLARRIICQLPFAARKIVTGLIAALVYWPAARMAGLLEKAGAQVDGLPLTFYRNSSFYTMRTDALDRFGTRLEQRFTRAEIEEMMAAAGLVDVRFREHPEPYWVACGRRAT